MLIIGVRNGDTTTITTPNGETISIVMLSKNTRSNEVRLGITAPDSYQILRDTLRKQMQTEFHDTPIFQVSSARHPTLVIADSEQLYALRHYQRRYPDSEAVQVKLIENRYRYDWYKVLEDNWMRDSQLPVSVEITED